MQPSHNAIVYIVDDDASVREALAWLLRSRHLLSESFPGAEPFDAMIAGDWWPAQPSCLNRAERMVFQLLRRSAVLATDFFRIPLNRVVELGAQVAI